MSFTTREWWGLIHGMGLGALFLLAFAGGLAGLYSLKPALITPEGVVERMRRLKVGVQPVRPQHARQRRAGTWGDASGVRIARQALPAKQACRKPSCGRSIRTSVPRCAGWSRPTRPT